MSKAIEQLTDDELRAELERRQKVADLAPAPRAPSAVDWSRVYNTMLDIVADASKHGFLHDDRHTFVYEAVAEAIYDKEFWTWSRSRVR